MRQNHVIKTLKNIETLQHFGLPSQLCDRTGKSTLIELIRMELQRLGNNVTVENTDQQQHVTIYNHENADFTLYDTAGAFTERNIELLKAASNVDDAIVIVPMRLGDNDYEELNELVVLLRDCGVLKKCIFVLTNARVKNSNLVKKRKIFLRSEGLKVANYVFPMLDAIAEKKFTNRVRNEISQLLHEILE